METISPTAMKGRIIEVLAPRGHASTEPIESVADGIVTLLDEANWHDPSDCPQDSLEVENCHVEPCKSVSL